MIANIVQNSAELIFKLFKRNSNLAGGQLLSEPAKPILPYVNNLWTLILISLICVFYGIRMLSREKGQGLAVSAVRNTAAQYRHHGANFSSPNLLILLILWGVWLEVSNNYFNSCAVQQKFWYLALLKESFEVLMAAILGQAAFRPLPCLLSKVHYWADKVCSHCCC